MTMAATEPHREIREYTAGPEEVWDRWTTPEGISSWWAPDGFRTEVTELDLRPGGALTYTMTAVGDEQVEFMRQAGMPLSTVSHKRFTRVEEPRHLDYVSVVDFVPDHPAYEHLTTVLIEPSEAGAVVTMTIDPMHDEVWTTRVIEGRCNELDNLAAVLEGRHS